MTSLQFKPALKRKEAEAVAAAWLQNRNEILHFLTSFEKHSTIAQRKGLWVLGIIHEIESSSLESYHDILYKIFNASSDAAVRREIFQILLGTRNEKIRGAMLDAAIACIQNPASSVAECHHALQWLLEPSKKHPELARETITALTTTSENRTPAWSRYAAKQIIRLQNQHQFRL